MARERRQEETVRVNYMVFRTQDDELRKLDREQPIKGGLSGHIRRALDRYLDLDPEEREHYIPSDIQNILNLIDFMRLKTPKIKSITEYELQKGDLMLMFGKEWYKMKSVVDMTISAFKMKKIDVMEEVMTVDVGRKEKYGFRIIFPAGMTREKLQTLKEVFIEDVKGYGRIKPVNGNEE